MKRNTKGNNHKKRKKNLSEKSNLELAENKNIAQQEKEDSGGSGKKEEECKASEKEEKEKSNGNETQVLKPKKKKILPAVIVTVLLFSILALVYLYGMYYYKYHFFPAQQVNGLACGNFTAEETIRQLQDRYNQSYSLVLMDRDGAEVLTITASDAQLEFSIEQEVEEILASQNTFGWIGNFFSKRIREDQTYIAVEFDDAVIEEILVEAGIFDSKNGKKPTDAYISEYLEDINGYEIIPEKEGTLLDRELTVASVCKAISNMDTILDLSDAGCYRQPEITADNKDLQAKLEKMNKLVSAQIIYDWNGEEEVVDGELIHNWLMVDGKEVSIDTEQVKAFVEEKAKEHDTYGKKRDFVTTLGVEVRLPSGAYGWKTDKDAETEALIELIMEGAVTEREPEYISRGWSKGINDIGNSYVEIDLTNQHLYLYKEGELILETDFVSGDMAKGNATPQGVFGLTYKTTDAVLRGRDYETPVNYWMPFNGNVGMHDATWRRRFGGDIYLTNGSHGCVNLPLDMAASIYSQISTGFPIICYY